MCASAVNLMTSINYEVGIIWPLARNRNYKFSCLLLHFFTFNRAAAGDERLDRKAQCPISSRQEWQSIVSIQVIPTSCAFLLAVGLSVNLVDY